MHIPMIDTLSATLDIQNYEEEVNKLLTILESKKNEAKLVAANNASDKVLVTIGNMNFQVLSNGSKGYAYILHNDYYEVKLAQYRSKKEEFFPVYIRVKSEWLWSNGPLNSWEMIVDWLNKNVGKVITNKINRLDLCCHTDEIELVLEDIETFKGKFFNDQVIRDRRKVTGINLGSRNSNKVYCRIYDKVREVNVKKKKLWFYTVWNGEGLNTEKVWNVEFELARDFLKKYHIDTVEDAFNRIKSIWEYCTKEWLVKVKLDCTRIERCSIDESWIKIQNAFTKYKSESLVKREEQLKTDASAMVPGAIGNITSYAAKKGITDINMILTILRNEGSRYLNNAKKVNYSEAIIKKMATT